MECKLPLRAHDFNSLSCCEFPFIPNECDLSVASPQQQLNAPELLNIGGRQQFAKNLIGQPNEWEHYLVLMGVRKICDKCKNMNSAKLQKYNQALSKALEALKTAREAESSGNLPKYKRQVKRYLKLQKLAHAILFNETKSKSAV